MNSRVAGKFFLICLFLAGVPLVTYSQKIIPQIGVTLSRSSLNSKDTHPHSTKRYLRPGITAGIEAQLFEPGRVSFQSGIFYVQKGSKSSHLAFAPDNLKAIHRFDIKLEYLEFPAQARILLKRHSKYELYSKMGGSFSYWIGGECYSYFSYDNPSGGPPFQGSGRVKIKYDGTKSGVILEDYYITKPFDVSAHLGLGLVINNKVSFDLSYVLGFADLEFFYEVMANNRVFQITVGAPMNLKRSRI